MKKYLLLCTVICTVIGSLALFSACTSEDPVSPRSEPVIEAEAHTQPDPTEDQLLEVLPTEDMPTEEVATGAILSENPPTENVPIIMSTRDYGDYIHPIGSLDTLLNLTDGFVYIGRPTCPSCNRFMPLLTEATTRTGTHVYYLNTDLWSMVPGYDAIRELFDIRSVPRLFIVENGTPRRLDIGSDNDGSWEAYLAG